MVAVGATTFGAQKLRIVQAKRESPQTLRARYRDSGETALVDRNTGYPDWRRGAPGTTRRLILDRTQYLEKASDAR